MAEQYKTNVFAPTPAPAAAPAQPSNGQGAAPAPAAPQDGGGYKTDVFKPPPPAANGQSWVPSLQDAEDWGKIYGQEWGMGLLPLRAQAEAARQRLGPIAAGSADLAGSATSPSQLLNLLGGPELAGGVHEGVKSYMSQPDWIPGPEGWKKIGEDTAFGAATGGMGRGAAAVAPALTRLGVAAGIPAGTGAAVNYLFGNGDLTRGIASYGTSILGALGAHEMINDASKAAADVMRSPIVRQAVKSVTMGGGSALRNAAGPFYDRWFSGQ